MRYVTSIVLVSLLTGCAAQAQFSSFAPSGTTFSRDSARTGSQTKIFIADNYHGVVDIFDANGNALGQITGVSPNALAIDAAANLWLTDGAAYNLQMYPPPYSKAALSLRDTAGTPAAIAVNTAPGPQHGVVAVVSFPAQGNETLRFFKPPDPSPCKTLVLKSAIYSLSFDTHANLYAGSYYFVQKIHGGCAATQVFNMKTGNQIPHGGIQVAVLPNGSIAVLAAGSSSSTIYTYAPPSDGNLGNPIATTTVPVRLAFAFAFTADAKYVWINDGINNVVDEFTYPGGQLVTSFPGSFDYVSLAVSPPAIPH